jgi:hypothetical protein
MFGAIKIYENWRKLHNKELMQLFGSLDIILVDRKGQLNWIGHVNRMDSKGKISQVISNNNPQGSRLTGRPKNRWWNCVQTNINKFTVNNRKERSKNRPYWERSI